MSLRGQTLQVGDTLVDRFESASDQQGRLLFCGERGERSLEWASVHERARSVASVLQRRGVAPGETVALLGPTSVDLVIATQAVLLCGARVVLLPPPKRGDLAPTRDALDATRTKALLVEDRTGELHEALGNVATWELATLRSLGSASAYVPPRVAPNDIAVLQLTSGTTRHARAVAVSHRNITSYLDAAMVATDFDPDADALVSWLPLYHDMGLIGYFLAAMTSGASLLLAPSERFVKNPARWAQWIARFGRVQSAGPNLAYVLLARALRGRDGDLSSWKVAINGGEHIDSESLRGFVRTIDHGFPASSVTCGYGLAEATLGVTLAARGGGMSSDTVDADTLQRDRVAVPVSPDDPRATELVRLGKPLPGVRVRVVDEDGAAAEPRALGEIQVSGPTVTRGYLDGDGLDERLFDRDWLRTGDFGYLAEGEAVICSRLSDLIVIRGRNIPAEEVERLANVPGTRLGGAAAFGVRGSNGTDDLVVIAESSRPSGDTARAIAQRIRERLMIAPADVVVVRPGRLPRTSSGKLRRHDCRREFLDGSYRA